MNELEFFNKRAVELCGVKFLKRTFRPTFLIFRAVAFSANGEGLYVYAPKQKGNVKEQLGYIGRYIRRLAIALHRIEEYDDQYVTCRYHDKKDGQEKLEKLTVEEFIARLIVHIPDEKFKMIRYYGVYSRRIKVLCKKLITV